MPDWKLHIRSRLASLRLSPGRESEITDELAQHLDDRWRELMASGASADEAMRLALAQFRDDHTLARNLAPLRQAQMSPSVVPGVSTGHWLSDLRRDLRYAGRLLRKQPGFATAVVLTLALGIGINSAIFALVDATLLRPLPLADPDRVVMVWERTDTTSESGVSPLNLLDWDARNGTFEAIGGFVPRVGGMVLGSANGIPDNVPRQWVTARYFDALGVKPIVGRLFLPSDDGRGTVVVLTESFWRSRFNANPNVVGTDIRLDGQPWTVVGVAPDSAQLLPTSIWGLLSIARLPPSARAQHSLRAVGHLKSGMATEAAAADLSAVAARLATEFPTTNAGRGIALQSLQEFVIGDDLQRTSALFLGVVGVVLLLCCANVANLLVTRATGRTRELALRAALGADRGQIIRQLLTESVLLSVAGGVGGVAIGWVTLQAAPALIPEGLVPAAVAIAFNLRVIVFCAATSLALGLVVGLAPAWQATDLAATRSLISGGRGTTGRTGAIRNLLVGTQVATAVFLLFAAGLLLRTLLAVERVDRGYGADQVLTMLVDPLESRYPNDEAEIRLYRDVEAEVVSLPGVQSAAWATTLPLGRSYQGRTLFEVVGETLPLKSRRPEADFQIVSPTYFATLDIPIISGRGFEAHDGPDGPPVCIVNEAFVRRFLHGRTAIGARVAFWSTASPDRPLAVREVIGVANQVKGRPDEAEEFVQLYVPLAQQTPGDAYLLGTGGGGRSGNAGAGGTGGAGASRQGPTGERPQPHDARRGRLRRHGAPPVPGGVGRGLRRPSARPGDGGVVRQHCLHSPAAPTGVRRATGARRNHDRRLPVGSLERGPRDPGRGRRRPCAVRRPGSVDRLVAVRRSTVGRTHVRARRTDTGAGEWRGDRRPGVARDADQSGRSLKGRVTVPVCASESSNCFRPCGER